MRIRKGVRVKVLRTPMSGNVYGELVGREGTVHETWDGYEGKIAMVHFGGLQYVTVLISDLEGIPQKRGRT